MSDSSIPSKASGAQGEKGDGSVRKPMGAEGGTSKSPADGEPSQISDPMQEYLGCRKKTFTVKSKKRTSKENVPPSDIGENVCMDKGPSTMGERKVLQEKTSSASEANKMDTSRRNLPSPEKKIFQLKKISEISAKFVSPRASSESDEKSALDCSANTCYEPEPPKPKRDPRNNLGNFHPMVIATSVSDLWAFDAFIGRSGAFMIKETEKIKSYRCQERFRICVEDDESDLEKVEDIDAADDFLNLEPGVNYLGGALCKGHFKVQKLTNQIYRVKTSSDSLCDRCVKMVPVPGLTPSQALLVLKKHLMIEPFLEEVNDEQSSYKVAWIHGGCGKLLTAEFKDVLSLSKFNDCVSISVEVASRIMRRDTMFFPFAFLVGNDLSKQDIERFLVSVIEKCNLSSCSYILTSNNHDMFASICSSCISGRVSVIPNFFMVMEQLRESWLGKNRGICDFDNSSAFNDYVEKVRDALYRKIIVDAFPTVEKALEHSLGLDYCEISNIKQIRKAAEDYVRLIIEAGISGQFCDAASSKVDYILTLELIAKQPFEVKIRYLDNCSSFRGNHVILMMPGIVNP